MPSSQSLAIVVLIACAALLAAGDGTVMVPAKPDAKGAWKDQPSRTVAGVDGFVVDRAKVALDVYGGRSDVALRASGFFRVEKPGRRWWLIDPLGHPFLHLAVNSVRPERSPGAAAAFAAMFKDDTAIWAATTTTQLRGFGFNGSGAWSADDLLGRAPVRIAQTRILQFAAEFATSLGKAKMGTGHHDYSGGLFPALHPDFPAFCMTYAKSQLAAAAADPWLLGVFSDNELPTPDLRQHLGLDPADPYLGALRAAAQAWLAARYPGQPAPTEPSSADRGDFVAHVWERYAAATSSAIRAACPGHLCLGSRWNNRGEIGNPAVWQAAAKHLDLISINLYGRWSPDRAELERCSAAAACPFLVTEFYTKGADTAYSNSTGAGWIVPTQRDRGLFYQQFTLALLETGSCVGWHWFKYLDNDPQQTGTDPSNRSSNKGILDLGYQPYPALTGLMSELNRNVYALADHFDRR